MSEPSRKTRTVRTFATITSNEREGANATCIPSTVTPIFISNRREFRRVFFSSCIVGRRGERGANAAPSAAGEAPRRGTRQLIRWYAPACRQHPGGLSPGIGRAVVKGLSGRARLRPSGARSRLTHLSLAMCRCSRTPEFSRVSACSLAFPCFLALVSPDNTASALRCYLASVQQWSPRAANLGRTGAFHSKSLLASLAMMAYLDLTSGKRVLLCDEDGRPFVSGACQARYCSDRCRNRAPSVPFVSATAIAKSPPMSNAVRPE